MITPIKLVRKPFHVEAVQVTEENMSEVAEKCDGHVIDAIAPNGQENPRPYIKVKVHHPLNERQTKAFVGDWVLFSDKGSCKVYTDKAIKENFDPKNEDGSDLAWEDALLLVQASTLMEKIGQSQTPVIMDTVSKHPKMPENFRRYLDQSLTNSQITKQI